MERHGVPDRHSPASERISGTSIHQSSTPCPFHPKTRNVPTKHGQRGVQPPPPAPTTVVPPCGTPGRRLSLFVVSAAPVSPPFLVNNPLPAPAAAPATLVCAPCCCASDVAIFRTATGLGLSSGVSPGCACCVGRGDAQWPQKRAGLLFVCQYEHGSWMKTSADT